MRGVRFYLELENFGTVRTVSARPVRREYQREDRAAAMGAAAGGSPSSAPLVPSRTNSDSDLASLSVTQHPHSTQLSAAYSMSWSGSVLPPLPCPQPVSDTASVHRRAELNQLEADKSLRRVDDRFKKAAARAGTTVMQKTGR